jgi:molybdopterin molybdotransferase
MGSEHRREAGFKERTRVDAARAALAERVATVERTERVPLADADGRALAERIVADRPVPHYRRAAMDGWAVRAADTFGASDRSPALLRADDAVAPERAVRVHTGSELPAAADAVVKVEAVDRRGDDLEVFDAVGEGENVAPVGEDVDEGQHLYDPGHRLRPSDLGLLRAVGVDAVTVREHPTVAVLPTGEELVADDPDPGEVVETNGLTVSRLVDRWGGAAAHGDVVTDDRDALRAALTEAVADHDVVVTSGGSSVGERDLVPDVVGDLGEVFVHGVALKPGHPCALGAVDGTPVLLLPGYPVACIVNAVQFLRPAVKWAADLPVEPPPTREATLARKVPSEPGVRTFARVRLTDGDAGETDDGDDEGDRPTAEPVRAGGAGVLSSVALSDGWVVVPESAEGLAAGERVAVQNWERLP